MILASLLACTPLMAVEGAVPVEPGSTESRFRVGYGREPGPVGTTTGISLPTVGFTRRFGLAPDTDLGVHAFTLGLGVDVRRRVVHSGDWSVAVAPGLYGMFTPIPSYQVATLDLHLPLRVERSFGERFSLMGGPGVVLRQTFAAVTTEDLASIGTSAELLAGGGLRGQVAFGRVSLGLGGAVYVDLLRGAGIYGGAAIDLGWRPRPKSAAGYGDPR